MWFSTSKVSCTCCVVWRGPSRIFLYFAFCIFLSNQSMQLALIDTRFICIHWSSDHSPCMAKGKDYDIIIKNLHTWPMVSFGSRWKPFSTQAVKQYTLKYHSHFNEPSPVICGCRDILPQPRNGAKRKGPMEKKYFATDWVNVPGICLIIIKLVMIFSVCHANMVVSTLA